MMMTVVMVSLLCASWPCLGLTRTGRSTSLQKPLESTLRSVRGGGGVGGASKVKTISSTAVKAPHCHAAHEGLSIFSLAINIIADLCPHGMLPLAYGMAAEGGTGIVPAISLLIAFGTLSAYTLFSIARASETTRETSFRGIWSRALDPKSAWLIDVGITFLCYGCCIFYAAFIGDLFSALAQAFNAPLLLHRRWVVLVTLHIFPLLPLCLMKNLSALQYSSFTGVAGILYTVGFVIKRFLDGSYAEGGIFHDLIDPTYRPSLPTDKNPFKIGPGAVSLMNMACVAFTTHYNGISYYQELKGRTLPRYAAAVGLGFGVSFLVFLGMMVFGNGTFGASAQALLLNNYHRTADPLATAARFATGFSILCGFPLMFAGLKTGFFSQYRAVVTETAGLKPHQDNLLSPTAIDVLSTILLSTICFVACNCTEEEVGFVIGIIGAILGTGVVYVIPALLNVSLVDRLTGAPRAVEKGFNRLIIAVGAVFSVLGTLTATEEHFPGFTDKLLKRSPSSGSSSHHKKEL